MDVPRKVAMAVPHKKTKDVEVPLALAQLNVLRKQSVKTNVLALPKAALPLALQRKSAKKLALAPHLAQRKGAKTSALVLKRIANLAQLTQCRKQKAL